MKEALLTGRIPWLPVKSLELRISLLLLLLLRCRLYFKCYRRHNPRGLPLARFLLRVIFSTLVIANPAPLPLIPNEF